MRSPVLIAETPFANGHGPRFLAPPGRGVEIATAALYIDRVREEGADVEEVEGDDYLGVRMSLADEPTGATAPQILVLAGVDANRMTGEERDEVLEQLRERLEVLGDAVAAIDWTVHEHDLVIELPELEEWHEAGWDVLPRTGRWAEDSANPSPLTFRVVDSDPADDPEHEPDPSSRQVEEPTQFNSEPEPRGQERLEDAGDPFDFGRQEEAKPELVAARPPEPEPPKPEPIAIQPSVEPPKPAPAPKVETPTQPPPAAATSIESPAPPVAPSPPVKPVTALLDPPPPRSIDPVQVSESADRSPSLAEPPAKPADPPRTRSVAFRWWVWGPWAAVVVLLTAKYLYLTQIDKTWNQRIRETHFAARQTKVVEVPAPPPAESAIPADKLGEEGALAAFAVDFRARLSQGDLLQAADLLHAWMGQVISIHPGVRPKLTELQTEFRAAAAARLQEWAAGRCKDRRFADAYTGLQAFESAKSVKAILEPPAIAKTVTDVRAQVRSAEDEYHYTQIRTLSATDPVPEERLKQHIDAYLALVEPPGRMLTEVQQLAEYRKWMKDGQPGKAVVTVKWGPRISAQRHTIELSLWDNKGGVPLATWTRAADARVGQEWNEVFPVSGITTPPRRIGYGVKTTRPTSAVEELVDGARERTESFNDGKTGRAPDVESGTVVRFELQGLVERPALPPWKDSRAPVLPVSMPKVGP
jgi:hypothetical protein